MDRSLAEAVRRRAGDRCEYCQFPASRALIPFQIDHIVAEKHGGKTELPNLALACFYCNNHKGPNIAGVDSTTGKLVRLFNPRTDRWTRHFEWRGAWLQGLTPVGRATVDVLNINREDSVVVRQSLLEEGVDLQPT